MKPKIWLHVINFIGLFFLTFSTIYADGGYGGGPRGWHGPRGMMSSSWSTHVTSSGTSDCIGGPPSCVYGYIEDVKPNYLHAKAEQLAEEAAQGEGPHLEVLSQLMGCSDEKTPQFSQLLKHNYSPLFVKTEKLNRKEKNDQILSQLEILLQKNSILKSDCQEVAL